MAISDREFLFVLPVPFYRCGKDSIATESAFAEHLKLIRRHLLPTFSRVRVAAPETHRKSFGSGSGHLGLLHEREDGVFYTAVHRGCDSRWQFLVFQFVPSIARLISLVRRSSVVNSGISTDMFRPIEILSLLIAWVLRKPTIFLVDIDERESNVKRYQNGQISFRTYSFNRLVVMPFQDLQIRWAVRFCNLVLLKSQSMVDDYGQGRPNVRAFYDVAYSSEHVIPEEAFNSKCRNALSRDCPLHVVYFGRLVPYKGVDASIRAFKLAIDQGLNAKLTIIGSGSAKEKLVELSERLRVDEKIEFCSAVQYGPSLFRRLYGFHIALATPSEEDTPRSAFDALAAGMGIVAYDTEYYSAVGSESGAITLSKWGDERAIAKSLLELEADRDRLCAVMGRAVQFARKNSQDTWLERRAGWAKALVS